ncbi:UvrD-helicase domain-containing protein [Pedobacter foliorum]|uniref:UvrD-helicase domain-containing protein n=1 Tax=Pedobacter foliorum TaxID=2739058 RepID=UPI0015631CEF|nr:UvrD-helicase domain-containing protein [Pedobacter foliorum]NRF37568.1 UvrD-helicase domain-containing protein [Pedobacter foliorum]
MPTKSKKSSNSYQPKQDLPVFIQIILFIVTLGLWYLFKQHQAELQKRENIRTLLPKIEAALKAIDQQQNMRFYFSNFGAEGLRNAQADLLRAIPKNYKNCGLDSSENELIYRFVSTHERMNEIRATYNQRFVSSEITKYKAYFSTLDSYPLSMDQMKAVVCDEDNNLVIAGAGTGKTTTISAKIAYILEKGLALPEQLLVISFTKSAVEEMFDRTAAFMNHSEQVKQITFRTFNSFGNMVTRYCSQFPKKIAFDGKDYRVKVFLQKEFDRLFLANADFQQKAINFIAFFARPERDEFDFKTGSDFIRHEKSFCNISLNDTHCKSKEEVLIANFLYLHQVEFEYESLYPLEREDRNPDFQSYQPDFFLPGYGIYHEHYGIDENGEVPDWFKSSPPFQSAKEQYHHGMQWKAFIHQKYGSTLIKTYSFQNRDNTLLRSLKTQLAAHGVVMNKRPGKEVLAKIKKTDHYEDFLNLVYTFLSLMKSNNASVNSLKAKSSDQRFSVFLDVFGALYQSYEQELYHTRSIDYNDMVNHATAFVHNGEFPKTYKYILVDEFQDMSLGRYGLIKALKKANPGAKLYAVGDDWQSIFRFTGSDISIITEFSKHFGVTAENTVLQTYRFNGDILALSSGFIQSNPSQLQKELKSPFKAVFPAFQLLPVEAGGNIAELNMRKWDALKAALSKVVLNHSKASVFLIGRYHHNEPKDLSELQKTFRELKITYYTAHACKGLTCDVAILLDLDAGIYGFPSEVADDPILNNLLHEGETFENAEERRLFYVALTRARHQVYLMYNPQNQSKFLEEIIDTYAIGNSIKQHIRCPKCDGMMIERESANGKFLGCNNYPHCKQVLRSVPNLV